MPSDRTDPLAEIVTHLQPAARFAKLVAASGPWRINRGATGQPFYVVIFKGSCHLTLASQSQPITLCEGDFLLVPAALAVTMSSIDPAPPMAETSPTTRPDGTFRLGPSDAPPTAQWLVGHFEFGSPDAALLVALLPQVVLVRGQPRLSTLVQLVCDESRSDRPARDVILSRLLEVLLVEAFRSASGPAASPGLMRGLADDRLAGAIRAMHDDPQKPWTIAQLAQTAALSRSAFFARFAQAVGLPPMEYLLGWRMARAKTLLGQHQIGVAEVAARVGYGSASAFSTAFTRHVGLPPTRFALKMAGEHATKGG